MNLYESIKNNLKENDSTKIREIISPIEWEAPEYRGAPSAPVTDYGINEVNFADNMRAKEIEMGLNAAGDSFEIMLTTQELFDNDDIETFVKEVTRVVKNALKAVGEPKLNVYLEMRTRGEDTVETREFEVEILEGE